MNNIDILGMEFFSYKFKFHFDAYATNHAVVNNGSARWVELFIRRVSEDVEFQLKFTVTCNNGEVILDYFNATGPTYKGGFHTDYKGTSGVGSIDWNLHHVLAHRQRQNYAGQNSYTHK